MIHELRIRGLGVIDEAVIPFAPGFTVLTGETGAGKTMVLSGLGLITGEKADAGVVRSGAERAEADGEWLIGVDHAGAVLTRLEEAGVEAERQGDAVAVLLGRSLAAGGRSRAIACGRTVPAGVLAEVAEHLIAVHGQSDQLTLRDTRRQRDLLDRYAGASLMSARTEYAEDFAQWRQVRRELDDLLAHRRAREREAALLRHGIDEIAAVEPVAGEDDALKAQATVLAHSTDLVVEISAAHDALAGGDDGSADSAADLIVQARRSLERAHALDPELAPVLASLDGLVDTLATIGGELTHYLRDVDADPQRLAAIEERRQQINALKRRYGPELDDVLQWWADSERTVAEVDGADDRAAELTAQVEALHSRVIAGAATVTKERCAAAIAFAHAVTGELHDLAMADAEVIVEVRTSDDIDAFTADGADSVEMLLVPHKGSAPRPLGKGASGGELSRIMLAIEVVLAGVNSVPTFVFDEVDAGIGGKVAVEVGRRLARLSRSVQVIVVTHLPQVAAFADQHVVVSKDSAGSITESSVCVVEGPERVRELVRMLSGLEDSQSGAEHAAELLELAAADRQAATGPNGRKPRAKAGRAR